MTKYPDLFAALAAPFGRSEVKQRQAPGGRQLDYVTARTVMNRLDDVLGPENWADEYFPMENSVVCKLTVTLPDGSKLTKCDAGGYAGMQDQGDDDKSGFSDAFKRAAVKFGPGRYLYKDGVPSFAGPGHPAPAAQDQRPPAATPPPQQFRQPAPAPGPLFGGNGQGAPQRPQAPPPQPAPQDGERRLNVPRSGKALFARVKDVEKKTQMGFLKALDGWAKKQGWDYRMMGWEESQVTLAYGELVAMLAEAGFDEAGDPDDRPVAAPPQAQQQQAASPAVQQARDFALKALREQAEDKIWKLADAMNPGDEPTGVHYLAALNKVQAVFDVPINPISAITDQNVLRQIIESAEVNRQFAHVDAA